MSEDLEDPAKARAGETPYPSRRKDDPEQLPDPPDPIPGLPFPPWLEAVMVTAARSLIQGFFSLWLGGNPHGKSDIQSPHR